MRKITRDSINAFNNNYSFKSGNTQVTTEKGETNLFLFGHLIAKKSNKGTFISNCGYETSTTKERLNGLLDSYNLPRIYQKSFVWYYEEKTVFPSNKMVKIA
jgi:hypothetical protein